MIPLRDANPTPGTPGVTYAVIALCTAAFLYQLSLGRSLMGFLLLYCAISTASSFRPWTVSVIRL